MSQYLYGRLNSGAIGEVHAIEKDYIILTCASLCLYNQKLSRGRRCTYGGYNVIGNYVCIELYRDRMYITVNGESAHPPMVKIQQIDYPKWFEIYRYTAPMQRQCCVIL